MKIAVAAFVLGLLSFAVGLGAELWWLSVLGAIPLAVGGLKWAELLTAPSIARRAVHCRNCDAVSRPRVERHVTTPGCLAGLLLFPIGLLYTVLSREDRYYCQGCKMRLS